MRMLSVGGGTDHFAGESGVFGWGNGPETCNFLYNEAVSGPPWFPPLEVTGATA